jgi:hypothetical protein
MCVCMRARMGLLKFKNYNVDFVDIISEPPAPDDSLPFETIGTHLSAYHTLHIRLETYTPSSIGYLAAATKRTNHHPPHQTKKV